MYQIRLVGGREVNFPETRRRLEKCKSNFLLQTFHGTYVDDPALLLFLGCLVNDQKGFTQTDPSAKRDLSPMSAYQVRRCFFAKSAHPAISPVNSHGYFQR